MSDPRNPPVRHPDELLAGYVDGSATPDERAVVDQHLALCPTCREEVQLAADARAALISLPELGAPGLAEAGVLALRRAAFQVLPSDRPGGASDTAPDPSAPDGPPAVTPIEPRARLRVAWIQLVAAAAIVAVLGGLIAIPVLLSKGGGKATQSAETTGPLPAPAASTNLPKLIDRGANYSDATLNVLAAQIAVSASERYAVGATDGSMAGVSRAAPAPTAPVLQDSSTASAALTCVIQGGGPPDGAKAIYLEQADVAGTPAYIGGFFIPNAKLNVMVIAVSRDGCQPLYSVRQAA
jgi:hypothetical protein